MVHAVIQIELSCEKLTLRMIIAFIDGVRKCLGSCVCVWGGGEGGGGRGGGGRRGEKREAYCYLIVAIS